MLLAGDGIPDGRCTLDGIAIACGWAMQMLGSGSAVQCPNNDCGPRVMNTYNQYGQSLGRVLSQPFQAFADGYSGFLPPGARYQGGGAWIIPGSSGNSRSGPPRLRTFDPSRPRGSDDGTNEGRVSGMLGLTPAGFFNHPQNPWGPRLNEDEYLAIRKEIVKALESERCRKFVDTLVRYNSGQHIESQEELPAFSDYIFNSQDGGIFWSSGINYGGVQVGRKMRIGARMRPDLNVVGNAADLMHELIHGLQGRGADKDLDEALRDLGIIPKDPKGQALPFPTGKRDGKPFNDWSGYWNQALKNACFPTRQ